jgi:NADH-quinone oxidoreductase subunit N
MGVESGGELLVKLLPEAVTAIAGCAILLIGVSGRKDATYWVPRIAFGGLVLALAIVMFGSSDATLASASVVASPLAGYTKIITLLVGLVIVLTCWELGGPSQRGDLMGMVVLSITGVMLVGGSGDLVVLILAIEMVSMPTYVLAAIGRRSVRAEEAGVKYFFLGSMSAAVTVYGFSFLYGATGETRLADIAESLSSSTGGSPLAVVGVVLALLGLCFKIGAAPLHFYVPDVYEGAATPVTGLLGFLPKLAGFVAIIKVLSVTGWLSGASLPSNYVVLILILAAVTMTVGNVLALLQQNVKRILAYSSIAHSGFMLLGVAAGPAMAGSTGPDGIAGTLFYMGVYGVMNLGAFSVLSFLEKREGGAEDLDDLAGLGKKHPAAALALAICVFSLMGIPPLAGFWAKLYVLLAVWSMEDRLANWLVMIAVVNAAIAAAYYLRIVAACYLRDPIWTVRLSPSPMGRLGAAICAVAVIVLGLLPEIFLTMANRGTEHLRGADPGASAAMARLEPAPHKDAGAAQAPDN